LQAFFDELGERKQSIKAVSVDMSGGYEKAIRESVPDAEIAFDPFHLVRLAERAVDQVRRDERNAHERPHTPQGKWIKGTRWSLLKAPAKQAVEQLALLHEVQQANKALYRGFLLKEELRVLYQLEDPSLAPADLVNAQHHEPVQLAGVEPVADHACDDLPDRRPPDPQQPGDLRLSHLLRPRRAQVLEIARVLRPGPRPRDRFQPVATAQAAQPSQLALDHAPRPAEIEMPPALHPPVLDLATLRPTTRAHPSPAPETNRHNHPSLLNATSRSDAPGSLSIRFNAVVTRTSSS
jgi:Transposase